MHSKSLPQGEQFGHYVANIHVVNPENTWPYTPSAYETARAHNFSNLNTVLYDRLEKYKNKAGATIPITYQATLADGDMRIVTV